MTVDTVFRVWVMSAIPITALVMYLTVNKIWVRRHELAVAQSISVAAKLLAIFAGIPFLVLYSLNGPVESAVKTSFVLAADAFLILIGIGFWVREKRGKGFLANILSALRLEREEAGTLLRDVLHPVAARQLVKILADFALIDRHLDPREREFIASFAARWRVDLDRILKQSQQEQVSRHAAYSKLRHSVGEYLRLVPPVEQAKQLSQVLLLLSKADNKTTSEEEIMLDELLGMLEEYTGGQPGEGFEVLIAPQNETQLSALSAQQPDCPIQHRLGGEVLRIGSYYSRAYAELVCDWYRDSGYLTFTTRRENNQPEMASS